MATDSSVAGALPGHFPWQSQEGSEQEGLIDSEIWVQQIVLFDPGQYNAKETSAGGLKRFKLGKKGGEGEGKGCQFICQCGIYALMAAFEDAVHCQYLHRGTWDQEAA